MLRVYRTSGEELVALAEEEVVGLTVPALKERLRETHGFPVCMQHLLQCGSVSDLMDSASLEPLMELQLYLKPITDLQMGRVAARELVEFAAPCGKADTVRLLLDGVDINWKDGSGQTALAIASRKGFVRIVRLLLEAGADPNIQDASKFTALMHAADLGHVSIVRLLLDHGANWEIKEWMGRTALVLASHRGHEDIVSLMTKGGGGWF